MAAPSANPPMPEFADSYDVVVVDNATLAAAVRPRQFIHIDQSECILCEGCVDICPWKCIHMVDMAAVGGSADPSSKVAFLIDEDVCTRCSLCVDRCPTGVITLGTLHDPPPEGDLHQRNSSLGYAYGLKFT